MESRNVILRDTKISGGCVIAALTVKYPSLPELEVINDFFSSLAGRYADFVKEKCFEGDEKRFGEYLSEGGRRSRFPRREYNLSISEVKTGREEYATFRCETVLSDSGRIIDYSLEYKTWNIPGQTLSLLSDLKSPKPRERFDGFYLRSGETVFYRVIPLWRERECHLRHIPSFETRVTPGVGKADKAKKC